VDSSPGQLSLKLNWSEHVGFGVVYSCDTFAHPVSSLILYDLGSDDTEVITAYFHCFPNWTQTFFSWLKNR
jgi:hypothetical protein